MLSDKQGEVRAVENVNFEVAKGRFFSLVGPVAVARRRPCVASRVWNVQKVVR